MARLKPEQRHLLVDAVKRGIKKCVVARVFGVTLKTVWYWCKGRFIRARRVLKTYLGNLKRVRLVLMLNEAFLL